MKKISIYLFSLSLISIFNNTASAQAYEEEKSYLSAGYGFGTFLGSLTTNFDDYEGFSTSLTGPVFVKYEYGITDKFGIGLNLAYFQFNMNYQYDGYDYALQQDVKYTEKDTYSTISALIRANWHFGDNDKVDPYFGLGLGYRTGNWTHTSTDPEGITSEDFSIPIPFGFETTFGVRVLFTDKIGAYAEAGLAKSAFQVGLCAKF
jgi:opacity protein-like surface antigen